MKLLVKYVMWDLQGYEVFSQVSLDQYGSSFVSKGTVAHRYLRRAT